MVKLTRILFGLMLLCLLTACDRNQQPLSVVMNAPLPTFVTRDGDLFVITHEKIQVTLQPMIGGRMASLTYDGHEMLITRAQSRTTMWGSVLWSSPQRDWGWPPVETLDSKPYAVTVEADGVVFTSAVDKKTGYQFEIFYGVVPGQEAIRMVYRIYNRSEVVKSVAPWEVTRVPAAGITFFPKGEGGYDSGIFYPLTLEIVEDIVWYPFEPKKMQDDHHKLLCDGSEGWLAYAHQGHLLVKQYEDIPPEEIATGEGEIELFINAEKTYLELEQQGRLVSLSPGDHLQWEVLWHIRKLPKDIRLAVGSGDLVNYVRGLLIEMD